VREVKTITEPGLYEGLPDEDYHTDPVPDGSLSSTFARLLTEYAPAKAKARRDTRKPTKAMNLGKAVHAHALGAGPQLIVWEHDGRTKAGKEERAAVADLLATEAAVAVTEAQRDQITDMVNVLRSIPEVRDILERTRSEVSAFWREDTIWGRARYDLLGDDTAFDYKTTTDATGRGFSKAMAAYGYHQQADWYQRGLRALGHDAGKRRMRFICQETEPPYIVQIHEPDDDAMDTAADLNDRAARIYTEAMKTGIWPGPTQLVNDPTPLPAFYFYDHEDAIGVPAIPELKL